jgi:hypothetical protein
VLAMRSSTKTEGQMALTTEPGSLAVLESACVFGNVPVRAKLNPLTADALRIVENLVSQR